MKPVEFKGQNVVFGEGQKEYQPLPALRMHDGQVITCWELSEDELAEVMRTKRIYLQQMTFNAPLQPIYISVGLDDIADI